MSESMTTSQDSVMARLRTETRPAHDRIEAVPFSTAILEERLGRSRFAGQLVCWHRVHNAMESTLSASDDTAVTTVWNTGMARAHLLEADYRTMAAQQCMPLQTMPQPQRLTGSLRSARPIRELCWDVYMS